jgi:DNA-binding GntR family transcriptional regulator
MHDEFKSTLHVLRSESLTSAAYKEIERMILSGQTSGRINENAVAAQLSISRGPIREALRALEQAGLVYAVANRGVFVRSFSLDEALQAYDVRASLFGLAGKILATRLTDEQLSGLEEQVEGMDRAKRGDLSSYYALNIRFHSTLVDLSGNAEVGSIYRRLVNKLHLFRQQSLLLGGGLQVSNQEHGEILAALKRRDPGAARERMEHHILAGKERLLKALSDITDPSMQKAASSED